MRRWSLGTRLSLWATASTFLLVLISTVYLYWSLVRTLDYEDDLLLADRIQTLSGLLQDAQTTNLTLIRLRVESEWAKRKFERIYAKILSSDGHVVAETPGFGNLSASVFSHVDEQEHTSHLTPAVRINASGQLFHAQEVRLKGGQIIQIALDRNHEETFLKNYRERLGLVLIFTLFLSALVGRRIALRGMRPVRSIAQTAARIGSSNLHERIAIEALPVELETLAITFNEMLDRLTDSFDRLSRFSADIAHELRTPINNLRGEIEVALGKPRATVDYLNVLGSSLEECEKLARLIDSLLFLARAEIQQLQIRRERIDLKKELQTVADFYEASASDAGIDLSISCPEGVYIEVERTLFQRALGNLIANALNYTGRGGLISVFAHQEASTVKIEVRDTGEGIEAAHLPRLFDRFYRVDQARSHKSGGTGLGLSIVRSIATIHGGSVEIQSSFGHGTQVTLSLPVAP